MTERQIKLSQTEDVKNFVRAASKCNFDIDVFYNRIVVDAKSILGSVQFGFKPYTDCKM